jgi:hypothetical protein
MNVEAFENLKRVLRSVPPNGLSMQNWNTCAIGHAVGDVWFQERRLDTSFASAGRVFGIGKAEAVHLFSARAGNTPDEVIGTIDWFVGLAAEANAERHARRQAIIDKLLAAASRAERKARETVQALAGVFGL